MHSPDSAKFYVLIPCAGTGQRSGAGLPKQYQSLAGATVLAHTLRAFEALDEGVFAQGLLVLAPQDELWRKLVSPTKRASTATYPSPISGQLGRFLIAPVGGATRAQSVAAGLAQLRALGAQDHDWVLVHDAARCLIQPEWIMRVVDACKRQAGQSQNPQAVGALLALALSDTLKRSAQVTANTAGALAHPKDAPGTVYASETLSRADKWLAQTPQCFPLGLLSTALAQAQEQGWEVTDEASALESKGLYPQLVLGHSHNIKITYPEDFALAEALLQSRNQHQENPDHQQVENPMQNSSHSSVARPLFRIGEGWDSHQLVDAHSSGRKLILGGVEIAHDKALLGHSDADALLHAITDALLGGAALGDIGRHFPDTDAAFHGADSQALLQSAYALVQKRGWRVQNLDATIIAQAPKLMPYMDAIRDNIARCLALDPDQVNVKAKTAEKLGPVGEGKSIEARAVALLVKAE